MNIQKKFTHNTIKNEYTVLIEVTDKLRIKLEEKYSLAYWEGDFNFENIKDAGDPVELAIEYAKQGADELVFLDITATNEKRKTLSELVTRIAKHINIPFDLCVNVKH